MAHFTENLQLEVVDSTDSFAHGNQQGNYNAQRLDTLLADLPEIVESYGSITSQVNTNTANINAAETNITTLTGDVSTLGVRMDSLENTEIEVFNNNTPVGEFKLRRFIFDSIIQYNSFNNIYSANVSVPLELLGNYTNVILAGYSCVAPSPVTQSDVGLVCKSFAKPPVAEANYYTAAFSSKNATNGMAVKITLDVILF